MNGGDETPGRRRFATAPVVDVAVSGVARKATEHAARLTAAALDTRMVVAQLARRYEKLGLEQRAGHLFEVMHAYGFTIDAIAKRSPLRAVVTTWAEDGSATAPVDIRIVRDDLVMAQAQAKLMRRAAATAHDLARDHYGGMQRVVAADKLARVERFLDKRLTLNPEGLRYEDYADARAHVTDTLHAEGVSSRPLHSATVHEAAATPHRWAARQVAGAAARQVGTAAAAGAAAGAVVTGVIEAAGQVARVRAGETSLSTAVCTSAGAAVRGAVRSGALAGLGESVRVAAATGVLPAALGSSTVPSAVVGAVAGVAGAGLAFARGDIGSGELAARSCESTLQTGLVWACGALGQTVLPVPVVGGLAGGLVGQLAAVAVASGLRQAVAAARAEGREEERIAVLEVEAGTAVTLGGLLGTLERDLGAAHDAYVTATVSPLVDDAVEAIAADEGADAVTRLVELTESYAGRPLFRTVAEFDRWMEDPLAVLTLDPNDR